MRFLRAALGLVALFVLGFYVLALVVGGALPWWAVVFGAGFWVLVRFRVGRRPLGGDVPAVEDGPRWSPFRERGF